MKTKKKILPDSYAELVIGIDLKELELTREISIENLRKDLQVKGFRKGKVPANLVSNYVDESKIRQEMMDVAINKYLHEALVNQKLMVLTRPEANVTKLNFAPPEGEPAMEMTVKVGILQVKDVADTSKWERRFEKQEVTEKELKDFLDDQRFKLAEYEEYGGPVKKDDKVEIDFTGKIGGIVKERLASKNYPAVLGKKYLLPEFEKAVIGMKKGEKKTFKMTFPKDYFAKEFAGKEVEFEVKVNLIWKVILPKLDDEFAKKSSNGHANSIEKLKKDYEDYMISNKNKSAYEGLIREFQDFLLKNSKIEFPGEYLNHRAAHQFEHAKHDLENRGLKFEDYLKQIRKTEEQFKENIKAQTAKEIALGFIMSEVIRNENIEIDPKEMKMFEAYYKSQKKEITGQERSNFRSRILIEKVYEKHIGLMNGEGGVDSEASSKSGKTQKKESPTKSKTKESKKATASKPKIKKISKKKE